MTHGSIIDRLCQWSNLNYRLYQHQYDEKEILSEEEENKPEDILKSEEVSTESDTKILDVPSTNKDVFEDEKSVKKVINENQEQSFKIDYGEFMLKVVSVRDSKSKLMKKYP